MGQQKFNSQLDELLHEIERTLPRTSAKLIKATKQIRLRVADILARYANEDSVIPRNKVGQVLTEVYRIEQEIYRVLRQELLSAFEQTAGQTANGLITALALGYGASTLLSAASLPAELAVAVPANVASFVFEALLGRTRQSYVQTLSQTPFNRVDSDGKRLGDRLREVARLLTNGIADTLRKSIRNGEVTSTTTRKTERSFRDTVDRLRLIAETEVLYVMRNGIALFAQLSGLAKGLRIQDYPHGKPGEHQRHKCYVYAHQDEYGLGTGVYPVNTKKIRNPHPQCRSTLHIVFKGGSGLANG